MVKKAMKNIEKQEENTKKFQNKSDIKDIICPECKFDGVIIVGKCVTCLSCGWSTCSP